MHRDRMQDGGGLGQACGMRRWCEPRGAHALCPRGRGTFRIQIFIQPHPRKFGQKQFLAVRRSWRGNGVACFWATSFAKKLSAAWPARRSPLQDVELMRSIRISASSRSRGLKKSSRTMRANKRPIAIIRRSCSDSSVTAKSNGEFSEATARGGGLLLDCYNFADVLALEDDRGAQDV